MPEDFVLSVSSLNKYLKTVMEEDKNLQNVYVKGEISGFKNHWQSGHFYFVLKDEDSEIKCAMFKNANQRLKFMPENSLNVICRGHIGFYDVRGEISLYIDDMLPDGVGALSIAFEQMKKRLEREGLFDESHKKQLPLFPGRIGVVTSESGAAIRDIINVISRRYPVAEVIICNAAVQGDNSAFEIASAIDLFNSNRAADVLIVGRGGGSVEDLWSFNEEIVARAIYRSEIPVVSAVGHETDFTISDFVADLRAPTPSAAAELVVPDIKTLQEKIICYKNNIYSSAVNRLQRCEYTLDILTGKIEKSSPEHYIDNANLRNDYLLSKINSLVNERISYLFGTLEHQMFRLDAFNPLRILKRGYSIVTKDDKVVSDKSDVSKGDKLSIRFENNSIDCEVI